MDPLVANTKEITVIVDKEDIKSIASVIRRCNKYEGLLNLYQDTVNGTVYLLVKKEQLDKEFIYFSKTIDGVIATGHYRGSHEDNKVFTIQKHFNRIEFVTENTSFYFDKRNALSKAADANISKSTMISQPIIAQDKDQSQFLVRADDIFLSEYLQQIKKSQGLMAMLSGGFSLGSLNKYKSKFLEIKSFPKNSNIIVEYVFDNPSSSSKIGSDVTDGRSVSIKIQHSIIEMPKNGYKTREDDPRVGFFTREINDMTSVSATPYKDLIHRWHLEKTDKKEKISEPVTPIVWWLENTTPVEYRKTIESAVLAWNEAFEEAGFKNAIEVYIQPDTALWDASDIRYNVIRWVSSPNPPFGGYGPSFVNPRTGQILGADIILEFVSITNRLKQETLFGTAGLMHESTLENDDENFCSLGHHLHTSSLFGLTSLVVNDAEEKEKEEFIKSALYYLVLHEVGHTLGLNHNMKASQLYSPLEIHNKELTSKTGMCGSVMDYPAVNLSADKTKQGHYFTVKPGPYDKWAIQYGYSEALVNKTEEQQRLKTILSRSNEPALMFGNDGDDMRKPGRGIDPRVMIGDMSNDAITYSVERITLANGLTNKLLEKYSVQDESFHQLRNAYLLLTMEIDKASSIISRYIGGVYVDRSFSGQSGAGIPFNPVSYEDQKRAMQALSKYVFSSSTFKTPSELYSFLQMQRRGFNFMSATEDPKIHTRVLQIQKNVFDHILHPTVLQRINDSELYGNEYSLSEMLNDLTDAIFKEDLNTNVNGFRQNLQMEYINRLIKVIEEDNSKYDHRTSSIVLYQINKVEKLLKAKPGINNEVIAHREHVLYNIHKALEFN
ncbi:MAG: zinc-dependent metalloprotease [Bacteroidetes bacterium]|nr:zinc-dependent metalloprotease [Bacteroidota bacterium]HET6244161.1 zinc-dependent metalloprotease [Bacteroidia bacterium]